MASKKNSGDRVRNDYIVVVVNKGKITHRYDCGVSITGATQCCKAIQDFGMGKFERATVVATPHKAKTAGAKIQTLEDLENSL